MLFQACTKDMTLPRSSSLTVINAVVGSNSLVTNFSNDYNLDGFYVNAQKLSYGTYSPSVNVFGSYRDVTNLSLYQMPDTVPHSSPIYNLEVDLSVGTIHTLFLTGTISSPDTMFTEDHPPYHPITDSSVGVRFVNLSPGSNAISVNLIGISNGLAVNSLPYKGITDFINYPVISSVSSYTFQFKDAVTGSLIGSYSMSGINNGTGTNIQTNAYRFKNFTIALIGLPGGTGSGIQKTILINNY